MKRKFAVIALVLAGAVCMSVLAACSDSSSSPQEQSSSSSSSVSESSSEETSSSSGSSQEEEEAFVDFIGEVTYSGQSYFSVDLYQTGDGSTASDYAALDVTTLVAAEAMDTFVIESDAEFYCVREGALADAAQSDVLEGHMIAVTMSDAGIQQIIILNPDAVTPPDEEEETEEAQTKVALVTDIADDGSLTLSLYTAGDDAGEITDPAAVVLENYTDSLITESYSINTASTVSVVEDGALTEASAGDIAVGDVVVIYQDADGYDALAVYPAE